MDYPLPGQSSNARVVRVVALLSSPGCVEATTQRLYPTGGPSGPLGFDFAQHRQTPRSSEEGIRMKSLDVSQLFGSLFVGSGWTKLNYGPN